MIFQEKLYQNKQGEGGDSRTEKTQKMVNWTTMLRRSTKTPCCHWGGETMKPNVHAEGTEIRFFWCRISRPSNFPIASKSNIISKEDRVQ